MSTERRAVLVLGLLIAAAPVSAATAAIRAGHIFDGERMLAAGVIIVRDGRIAAVHDSTFVVPDSVPVIDARAGTAVPGLVDSRCRFMELPQPRGRDPERDGPGRFAEQAMSAYAGNRRSLIADGVTAVIDAGTPFDVCRGMRAALQRGGIIGPALFCGGRTLTAPGGFPAATDYAGRHDLADGSTFATGDTAAARGEVARAAALGADFIRLACRAQPPGARPVPALRPEVARAAVDEAHRRGLRAFAEVGSAAEAEAMVAAGCDGIECGSEEFPDSLLAAMAARRVSYTPALSACARDAAALSAAEENVRRARALGVPVCAGTGFPASGGRRCGDDLFTELALLEQAGLDRAAALRAATAAGAAKLGRQQDLGAIAPGSRADVVVLAGDADTGRLSPVRVQAVMLGGRVVARDGVIARAAAGGFRETSVSLIGYPFWDPLLAFLFGGNVTDVDFCRTGVTASLDLLYSTRDMWLANLQLALPSPVPRTALRTGFHFDNQNRLFYGLGDDSRLGDTVEYSALIFREYLSGLTRIGGSGRLGTMLHLDQTRVRPYRAWSVPDTVTGCTGGNEVLFGLSFGHDTRDNPAAPWRGHWLALTAEAAPALLPHGHAFGRVALEARGFVSAARRHVLAGRLLYEQALGNAPFYDLPEFGGDTLGRGFLPFRLRDRAALIGQFEYRFPVAGFLSGVVFFDVGQFRHDPSRFRLAGFHPAIGFGPRFTFGPNEGSIVGIDVGFTPEGWNLVLHNGHVF